MATVERLDNSHPHTHVVAAAPKATPAGQVSYAHHHLFHHQSTKAGVGFYASRRPEPGKTTHVTLSCCPTLFYSLCNVPSPRRTTKGLLVP